MQNESTLYTQLCQRGCNELEHFGGENAQHLGLRAGRIRERAQKIKDGFFADLFASGNGMARGGVGCGIVEKTDTHFADRAPSAFEWSFDANAESLQYIGRTAARAYRAIPMFGDHGARGGGD